MSTSIYYTAKRKKPLTKAESSAIAAIVAEFSVDDQIAKRERTRKGPNWTSFEVYDPKKRSEPTVVFEGATQLPDNSANAMWIGLQHWCKALSAIRRILPKAQWDVSVDDHAIAWDAQEQEYDPSQ